MSKTTAPRAFGRRFRIAGATVAGLLAFASLVPAAGATAAGGAALLCDQNTIYTIGRSVNGNTTTNGVVRSLNLTSGALTDEVTLPDADNALAISDNGTAMYAFKNNGTTLDAYDPRATSGTGVTLVNGAISAASSVIRGAINPVTGIYYFASGGTAITVYAYDPATGAKPGQVATITGTAADLQNGNGDFAFSAKGVLFLAAQAKVLRVDQTLPTTSGNVPLTATAVADLPAGTNSPGIAFSSDGYLHVVSTTNILKIDPNSGKQVGSVAVAPPAGTTYAMTDLASCNYANTITGSTAVTERVSATDQFTVTIPVPVGTTAHGNTATTSGSDPSASAGPVLGVGGGTYAVTQTAAGTTDPANYTTSWSCTTPGSPTPIAADQGTTATFTMPNSGGTKASSDVSCAFTNTPKRVALQVVTALGGNRIDDADQFVVGVQDGSGPPLNTAGSAVSRGSGRTITSGTGDTGKTSVIVSRNYSLTQTSTAGSASRYEQYAKTVDCIDATGTQTTGLPHGDAYTGSIAITPVPGSDITCTVTAKAAPASVTITTALGDPRFAAGDQFTGAIHDGAAGTATVVGTGNATTTGSGSTVDAGTGTTTYGQAVGGSTYALTHTTNLDAGRYSRSISCTDQNGFQTSGLPSGAYDGSTSVAPVSGADIRCAVSVMLKGSGLRLNTALADPRFDDGDQFTATVHTGGANGPSANDSAAVSTTDGTGSTVTANTGTSGHIATARGTTYTITDATSANPLRYSQAITCTDLNSQQTQLPLSAPFTGSFDITPEPGADLVCTVTASAKQAVLNVSAQLGSDRFGTGDQFTSGLKDPSGAEKGAAASETTTGSGSQVTTGTGTTGDVAVAPNLAYTLLGSPVANADRYDRTIACTDGTGLQTTGLPGGAFTGSAAFTPQAGTAISCVVTTSMKAAAITATAALASARADDGDQWTVAWRTGGAGGSVVGDTSYATTTGTGSTVTASTGTTRYGTATNGVAYTLTDAVTAHASRYSTRLTCTDAAGKQTGLPNDVAFTDSAVVTPEAGSDLRCVVTAALIPGALALQLAAPAAAQVGEASTWTATITNGGGAAVSGAVRFAVPQGLTYSAVHGTGWTCAAQGAAVTCSGPALAGGATDAFGIDLIPAAGSEGAAVLQAAVDPAGTGAAVDPTVCTASGTPVAGCDTARTVVGSHPHLVLGITAPAALAAGAAATWNATVRNDGNGPAGSAVVALRLPDGVGSITASGADCTITGQDAVCTVPGPIAAGRTTAFSVTGTPSTASVGTAPVLRGRLDPAGSTTTGDPAACTTTDAATGCAVSQPVTVASGIALGVVITPPTELTEGVAAGYTVAVTNSGTGTAASPTVSVHLPDGLTYRGVTGATCTADGGDLTCTLPGVLPGGASSSFVVAVQPKAGSTGTSVAPAASVDPAGSAAPRPAAGCTATAGATGCAVADPRVVGRPAATPSTPAPGASTPVASPTPAPGRLVLTGTLKPIAPAKAQLVAGDRVRYSFTVTNRTGAPVDHVAVTVPGLGQADCAATVLAAGASTTCVLGPITVTQAQIDAGTVSRDAVAAATPASGTAVASNTITLSAPVRTLARISAVQTVRLTDRNGDGVAQRGERVTFSVRVTNTGTVTLNGVALADDVVRLSCPRTVLQVGGSMVCTGTRITTAEDVAAGGIRNVAVASARGVAKLGTVSSQRTVGTMQTQGRTAALAHTGSNLTAGVLAGGVLLGLGGLLLVAGRRRRRTA